MLQSPDYYIGSLKTELKATEIFLKNYRECGYEGSMATAREIADTLSAEPIFSEKRVKRKSKIFLYEGADDGSALTAEEAFKADFFFQLVDQALSLVTSRFKLLEEWFDLFGFLFTSQELFQINEANEIMSHCIKFEKKMGDVHPQELHGEILRFIPTLKQEKNLKNASDFLQYIYRNDLHVRNNI